MTGALQEEEWNRVGLTLLSSDEDRTLVLFSSTDEIRAFRERLEAYGRGTPSGQKNPAYAAFIAAIESIDAIEPRDRIGMRAREEGLTEVDNFRPGTDYVLDIEIWDLGRRQARTRKVDDIAAYVEARNGEELDRYIGPSTTLIRVRCDGAVAQTLLTIDEIAEIDFLPTLDTTSVRK